MHVNINLLLHMASTAYVDSKVIHKNLQHGLLKRIWLLFWDA